MANKLEQEASEPNTRVLQNALKALQGMVSLWDENAPDDTCACVGASDDCKHPPLCELCAARQLLFEHAPKSSLGSELPEADITFHETRYQRSSTSDGPGLPKAEEE